MQGFCSLERPHSLPLPTWMNITPDEILLWPCRILLLKLPRLLCPCLPRRVRFRPLSHFVINDCVLLFMLLFISSCHSHLLAEILLVHKCMTLHFYCWVLSVFSAVTLKDVQFLYGITMLCIDKVSQCSVINKCHCHILLSCCLNAQCDGHGLGNPGKVCLCHAHYRNWLLSYIRIEYFIVSLSMSSLTIQACFLIDFIVLTFLSVLNSVLC